jgi:O-antigen ligase
MLMGVYYLYAMCGFDSRKAQRLSRSLKVAGYLLASVIVVNYFVSDLSAYDMRSAQIENERNLALPLLPMAGVLAVADAVTSTRAWPTVIRGFGTVLIITAILMTVTRAMLVAFILGAAATVMLLVRRASTVAKPALVRRVLTIICLFAVVAIPFTPKWLERFSMERIEDVQVISGRLDEYDAFFELFLSQPLFGAGMGHVATDPQATSYMLRTQGVARPHSHFFFLAGTTGAVGIVLYYSVLGSAMMRLWASTRNAGHDINALACTAGMLGAGIAGMLYTFTTTMYNTLSYNIFLGVLFFLARFQWKPS